MKRIAYIYSEQPDYVRVQRNLELLSSSGYEVVFIGCLRGGQTARPLPAIRNVTFEMININLPHGGIKSAFLTFIFLIRSMMIVRSYRPDLVIGVNEETCLFYKLVLPRQRYCLELYDSLAFRCKSSKSFSGFILKKLSTFAINNSVGLVEVSDERLARHPKIDNVEVVPNVPQNVEVSKDAFVFEKPYIFVSGSVNDSINGIEVLYDAVQVLQDEVQVIVAGRPSGKFVTEKFLKAPFVSYLGYVSKQRAMEISENALAIFAFYKPINQIYRLASPNKIFDAMFCGTAILMNSDCLASKFAVSNGFGLVSQYNNSDQLKENIKKLLNGVHTVEEQPLKREFLETYSWEKLSSSYMRVIEASMD